MVNAKLGATWRKKKTCMLFRFHLKKPILIINCKKIKTSGLAYHAVLDRGRYSTIPGSIDDVITEKCDNVQVNVEIG